MKKLFQAIRRGQITAVKQLIQSKPDLVNCVAKQPPQKDDGQSPLQVALKTGGFEIAGYLIDMGADLNFIEKEPCCNEWRTPVLHDAIGASVMCCRRNINNQLTGFRVLSTKEKADQAFAILQKMIERGADVNGLDSHGNSGLWRFCAQADQILPRYIEHEQRESSDRIFTEELHEDLLRILKLLKTAGADVSYVSPNAGQTVLELYKKGAMSVLLNEVFGD